jgi:hypothetical protein
VITLLTAFLVVSSAPPVIGGSDSCATPDLLVGTGLFAFDNASATTGSEGQSQTACLIYGSTVVRNDVWFQWQATATGLATFSTCGTSTVDTKIAAYAGQGCPASAALACNDDACTGFQSTITFPCTAGAFYTLQLGLYPLMPFVSGGSGQLTLHVSEPPLNDACSQAIQIGGSGPFAFDNGAATTGAQGQNEVACNFSGQTAIAADQWFTWTSTRTGTATLSVCGGISAGSPDEDTKVAVYAGSGCPGSASIACNDDAGCGVNGYVSSVTFNVDCGATYTFQIGRFVTAGPSFGTFTVMPSGSQCPNAYCAGDGTATACPCGNVGAAGRGCANSIDAQGARLLATGVARISADTLVLRGSGMPNSTALYFQGTQPSNGGLGTVFGDGLRCAAGVVLRFGTLVNSGGMSQYPAVGGTPISVVGSVSSAGTRFYQIWYRNADPTFCTPSTFNLSNGLNVAWAP